MKHSVVTRGTTNNIVVSNVTTEIAESSRRRGRVVLLGLRCLSKKSYVATVGFRTQPETALVRTRRRPGHLTSRPSANGTLQLLSQRQLWGGRARLDCEQDASVKQDRAMLLCCITAVQLKTLLNDLRWVE